MKLTSIILIFAFLILILISGCDKSTRPKKDNIPPAAITDLRIATDTETPVTLEWTAPGDDGNKGTASWYAIRYSTDSTVVRQWDFALRVLDKPLPKPAGTKEQYTVSVPPVDSNYYFGIKSQDEAGNWSALSNIASEFALGIGGIAFVSDRDGNSEIYVVSSEGSYLKNITQNEADDWDPVWSSDRRIAFMSDRSGTPEIYVADSDGGNQQRLTFTRNDYLVYSSPTFSPDGSKIAFEVDSIVGCFSSPYDDIYVVNSNGARLRNLTQNSGPVDFSPSWSPDGTKMAFVSSRDGSYQIYIMNSDGSNHQRVTSNDAQNLHAMWSPNGTEILFISAQSGGSNVYVINADGTDQRRLTSDGSSILALWSPDGTKIAYVSGEEQGLGIFVMNANGSNKQKVFTNLTSDQLSWSPNGTRIAFHSGSFGEEEVYVINANGTNQLNVSKHPTRDLNPVWSSGSSSSLWRPVSSHPRTFPQTQNGFSGWQLRSLCFTMAF